MILQTIIQSDWVVIPPKGIMSLIPMVLRGKSHHFIENFLMDKSLLTGNGPKGKTRGGRAVLVGRITGRLFSLNALAKTLSRTPTGRAKGLKCGAGVWPWAPPARIRVAGYRSTLLGDKGTWAAP